MLETEPNMKAAKLLKLGTSIEKFEEMLRHSLKFCVDHIEYRTFDEGLCSANIFLCKKSENSIASLCYLSLMIHAVHFYEEWRIEETLNSELHSIAEKWLIPAIQKVKNVPHEDARRNVQKIVSSIENCISEKLNSGATFHPDRWGVFFNNRPQANYHPLKHLPYESDVLALADEWNNVEYLYETPNFFALFSWGTGA
jgi:hypothetical protein